MSMRKTQLDASTPRELVTPPSSNEQPKVNYYLPLVATLIASIAVVFFVALLTFSMTTISANLFSEENGGAGSIAAGGFCGLVALIFAAATLFFIFAVTKVVRDFFTPMQIAHGVVTTRQTSRGRGGAHWISVNFDPAPAASSETPTNVLPTTTTTAATSGPLAATSGTAARQIAPTSGVSFGAQLNEAAGTTGAASKDDTSDDKTPLKLPPKVKGKSLRVDKNVFDALAVGDEVVVAYSPNIEHVYYVQRLSSGGNHLLLRNTSLI